MKGFCLQKDFLFGHSPLITTLPPSVRAPDSTHALYTKPKRRCQKKAIYNKPINSQFELMPPPYSLSSLEPYMSRQTLEYHWGRHHRSYVENLNMQVTGTELDGMSLEEIIIASYNKGNVLPAFNNAAQVWNHDFFWQSMKPGGGGRPSGVLMELIERDFGSFDVMLRELKLATSTQFGSGWGWLAYKANRLEVGNALNPRPSEKDNKLIVARTPNAVNPLVWDYSHAYYLDYENRQADYVQIFMDKLVSWETVSARLEIAMTRAAERAREEEKQREEDEDDMLDSEAVEMYLDSDNDDSEPE
ncbi:hypothetical protein QJS04_geneDACA008718 [Acorus gramineus]|uniref:superoxide dismutase n=1 Tax=Acorus gramineus TaxID=55184 RepID=A0AAV9ACR3_ACOGR|nr:hypothetical protein QJS04_geneDACA008718 [Acorus gramineus]